LKNSPFLDHVVWCADGLSDEQRDEWLKKVRNAKIDTEFWENDAANLRKNLEYIEEDKDLVSETKYKTDKAQAIEDERMSSNHYKSSKRQLEILERDGPRANRSAVNNTAATTRSISEVDGSNEQPSSSKRR